LWLRERWYEKDALMEQYLTTGRFPPTPAVAGADTRGQEGGYLETEVRTKRWYEFLQIFSVIGTVGALVWTALQFKTLLAR